MGVQDPVEQVGDGEHPAEAGGDEDRADQPDRTDEADRVPRSARCLVGVLFVALLSAGLIGFELWPMTAWRMFSAPRGETQNFWVLEGVAEDGSTREVELTELPMAYSNAEWPLRSVNWNSAVESEEICQVLVEAVVEVDPDIVELQISRDGRRLVREDSDWEDGDHVRTVGDWVIVTEDRDVKHACSAEGGR